MSKETKSGVLVGGFIQKMILAYMQAEGRREEFVAAACAIDREYLEAPGLPAFFNPIGKLDVDAPEVTAMIAAIANAFIDEGMKRLDDTRKAPGAALAASMKEVVHEYLVNNGDDLVEIAVGLDRAYLGPYIFKNLDDETIPGIVRAIAEECLAEGVRQTS